MGSSEDCRWRRAEDAVERTCFYPLLRKLPKKKGLKCLELLKDQTEQMRTLYHCFICLKKLKHWTVFSENSIIVVPSICLLFPGSTLVITLYGVYRSKEFISFAFYRSVDLCSRHALNKVQSDYECVSQPPQMKFGCAETSVPLEPAGSVHLSEPLQNGFCVVL